jgi:outer membrane lipoprotein carrier protein
MTKLRGSREQGSEIRDQARRRSDVAKRRSPRPCAVRSRKGGKAVPSANLRLAFLLCFVFLSHALSAQDNSAHALAQLVDSHYNKLHSLRAGFTESYRGLGVERTESGTLLLLKPGRMRWDYAQPAGKVFLIDGKYAWFYAQGSAQVQRIPAKKLDDLRSPLRFLLGHTQLEKELTGLHLVGGNRLIGQPEGQQNRVKSVSLTIAPTTGAITAIEIEEVDGAVTRFAFTGEQANGAIPEKAFDFVPPAGVPVVDALPPV